MKPVRCSEIAVAQFEFLRVAPQGLALVWITKAAVFLGVKSQLQLGVRRNLLDSPRSAAAVREFSAGSPTSTEDCGWRATLA